MNILVACEESQIVTEGFRKLGHKAFSCDYQSFSGKHPEWHISSNVIPLLNGFCRFKTLDGKVHYLRGRWDMIIAFPPCTYLTVTGNRWFNVDRYGGKALERIAEREEAIRFFMLIANSKCTRIAIENPVGCMSSRWRKPDQVIHPYYFANEENDLNCERKATCLWLKGLPPLEYRIRFSPRIVKLKNGKGTDSYWHFMTMTLPKEERSIARSKTFPGIAQAMVDQWGSTKSPPLRVCVY